MIFLSDIVSENRFPRRSWSNGALAGLAGGCAEVVWIAFYAQLSGSAAAPVARGVTGSLFPGIAATLWAVPLGVVIHLSLAVVLGIAITLVLRAWFPRLRGSILEPVMIVAVLIGVWAANFFLVLPALNPGFVALVPYSVSLFSKVLFGFAAALVLHFFP